MIDTKRLRELAEKATKGPWIQLDDLPYLHATDDQKAKPWGTPVVGRFDYSANDMAFVAAANPQTILSLLDRVEQDDALMRRMLKTMEFIEGCNGVAVLDPIDRQELLDDLRKRLEQS